MEFPIQSLSAQDDAYPKLLQESAGHPPAINYRGALPTPDDICIAIVGTRKATREGKGLAYTTAEALARRGFTIVSGLALGIDGAAHEGALAAQGKTIAVLANGLDSIYPRQHEHLAESILESGGCLISEYPDESPAYPNQFLERNRIVSGLCIATIVIEAPIRSGSLATARLAIEQGREVFVFPGGAHHTNYQGSHKLIREGARLVTSVQDILDDLGLADDAAPAPTHAAQSTQHDPVEAAIIKTLADAQEPLSIDRICELTTLEPHIVSEKITLLMMNDTIIEHEQGFTLHP